MKYLSLATSLLFLSIALPLAAANRDVAIGNVLQPSAWSLLQSAEFGWWHADNDVVGYHRIPYAEPPVQHKAFHVPVPYAHRPWPCVSTLPALNKAKDFECIQQRGGIPLGQADCLYLNVYRPNSDYAPWPAARYADSLPVVVWIHGGSMIEGNGLQTPTMLKALARRGLVVVSLNYRLGILGFATKVNRQDQVNGLIDADGLNGTAGNYGLWDQQMAIQWVRDNISRFGGDAARISLMGWSAGGYSALAQASTKTKTVDFQSVIQQSGFVASSPLDEAVMDTHENALTTASYPGFGIDAEALNNPCPNTNPNPLLCWRLLSANPKKRELFEQWMIRATEAIESQYLSIHRNFYAVHHDVPGAFFQEPFWTEFSEGFNRPLISLANEHEFEFAPATLEQFWSRYWSGAVPPRTYGPNDVGILLNIEKSDFTDHFTAPSSHYAAAIGAISSLPQAASLAARIWSDVSLCLNHDILPSAVAAHHQDLIRRVRLDDAPDVVSAFIEYAAHGFDMFYLDQLPFLTPAEKQLGVRMQDTWAAFLKDPTALVNYFWGGNAVTVFEVPGDIHSPPGAGEVRGEYLSTSPRYAGCSTLAAAGLLDPVTGVVALGTATHTELGY